LIFSKIDDAKEYELELRLRRRQLRKDGIAQRNLTHHDISNNEE
jgi:hypothetical protein